MATMMMCERCGQGHNIGKPCYAPPPARKSWFDWFSGQSYRGQLNGTFIDEVEVIKEVDTQQVAKPKVHVL
jgi:hypothetical protein